MEKERMILTAEKHWKRFKAEMMGSRKGGVLGKMVSGDTGLETI